MAHLQVSVKHLLYAVNKFEYEDIFYGICQTCKLYAPANMLLRNFRYCIDDDCMLFKSFCANMYCFTLWFNSTSSSIKKLKTRNSILIMKPYSASKMFVIHGIHYLILIVTFYYHYCTYVFYKC